jgi:hypothetical protein
MEKIDRERERERERGEGGGIKVTFRTRKIYLMYLKNR